MIATYDLETSDFKQRAVLLATSIETTANVAIVVEALTTAQDENGYQMDKLTVDQLVNDLCMYCADCENMPLADVRAGVLEWKAGRQG